MPRAAEVPALSDQFVETALAAADAARGVTGKYFRAGLAVDQKRDNTPVTIADHEAEQRIKEIILARHPSHAFLGEESGESGGGGGGEGKDGEPEWRWVIDPIDGTKSFATGNPTFGTLIALLHHGRPVIGVIDHAALDERWLGVAGRVTTHNGAPCSTATDRRKLADASLYTTTTDFFAGASLARFNRLSRAVRFRVFGGDCYCYGLLASGFTDVVCEAQLRAHDFLALVAVVEGAGGVISDWHGQPLGVQSDGQVLAAANPELHRAALAALAEPKGG